MNLKVAPLRDGGSPVSLPRTLAFSNNRVTPSMLLLNTPYEILFDSTKNNTISLIYETPLTVQFLRTVKEFYSLKHIKDEYCFSTLIALVITR